MAESSDKQLNIPWTTILVIVSAFGGMFYWLTLQPSQRPGSPPSIVSPAIGIQDIDARLWQDPFQGMLEHTPDQHEQIHKTPEILWYLTHQQRDRILYLPVMVPGRPFFEDGETRLRTRVAVISALQARQYVPDDAEHIGKLEISHWPITQDGLFNTAQSGGTTTLSVPYEWWHSRDSSADCVLLLWINEEFFSDMPLDRLERLLDEVYPLPDDKLSWIKKKPPQPHYSLLGPARSATLDSMVDEFSPSEPEFQSSDWNAAVQNLRCRLKKRCLSVYSAKATADETLLTDDFGSAGDRSADVPRQRVAEILASNAGVRFESTTVNDTDLCRAIVHELSLRGVDVTPATQDRVALICEWDTYYARCLEFSFAAAAAGGLPTDYQYPRQKITAKASKRPFPDWIKTFSYLRGIDGKLPGDNDQTPSTSVRQQGQTPSPFSLAVAPEVGRPEGRDQADYLLRLAAELTRQDREDRRHRAYGSGGFKAIGIFGSDAYDKIEILQAVRPLFSNVIFFTTDLDARLCTPAQWNTSHNLLIASPFGLRLNESLQRDLPPFRDTHQSGLFYATLLLLDDSRNGATSGSRCAPAARMFELGRHGPHDLSTGASGNDVIPYPSAAPHTTSAPSTLPSTQQTSLTTQSADAIEAPPPVQPLNEVSGFSNWRAVLLAVAIALAITLIFISFDRQENWFMRRRALVARRNGRLNAALRRFSDRLRHLWGRGGDLKGPLDHFQPHYLYAIFILMVILGWGLILLFQGPEGEPFAWFDGISIWPTEILRVTAAFLSLFFLTWWGERLQSSPQPPCAAAPESASSEQGNHAAQITNRLNLHPVYSPFSSRLFYSLRFFIPLLLLGLSAICLFGWPHVPYRGNVSRHADHIILVICVILYLGLACFAADAALLCVGFVRGITDPYSQSLEGHAGPGFPLKSVTDDVELYDRLRLIGTVTRPVENLLCCPFFILAILIVSMGSYFADWGIPWVLLIYFLAISSPPLVCAWKLRRTAEKDRKKLKQLITRSIIGFNLEECADRRERLKSLLKEVDAFREGAFGGIAQNPVLRSILLPSSGLGVWGLLQYVSA